MKQDLWFCGKGKIENMKKKILIVMMNLYNGGAEKSLINLLNVINYNLYDIDLLLFQKKGMFLNQISSKVNVLETPEDLYYLYNHNFKTKGISISKEYLLVAQVAGKLFMALDRHDSKRKKRQLRWKYAYKRMLAYFPKTYDIALGYIEGEPSYYVIDKVKAQKKYIWVHNDYVKTGLDKKYDQAYFNCADKIVTISQKCVEILQEEFPEFKQKIVCLPNISSQEFLKRRAENAIKLEFTPSKFKILSIGRLTQQKGFDFAINAAEILKQNRIDFQWIIIGDGKLKNSLKKLVKEKKLENDVLLVGSKENPYAYMKVADILVQSSRYEGKSVVLDEAKMLGLPVIATNYPTVRDQVDERWGYVVEMNAESIAKKICNLYKNITEIQNKRKYLNSLTYDISSEIKLYDDLLQS